jgi:hypothetical protein
MAQELAVTTRQRVITASLLLGGLTIAGCGGPILATRSAARLHDVRFDVRSTEDTVGMTVRVDHRAPQATNSSTESATTDAEVRRDARVSLAGGPSTGSVSVHLGAAAVPNQITCTITVDGVVRATQTVTGGVADLPTCAVSGYVGHRPFTGLRVLALLAVLLSLAIVVLAIGALVVPGRRAG